jgi:hypothetical protein
MLRADSKTAAISWLFGENHPARLPESGRAIAPKATFEILSSPTLNAPMARRFQQEGGALTATRRASSFNG